MSDSLWNHGLCNSGLPCPSLSPEFVPGLSDAIQPSRSIYICIFYINISSEQHIWTDFIQQMWFQQMVTFIGNWPGSSPQIRFTFSEVGPSPGGSSWRLCPLTPRPEMKGMTNKWHLIGGEGPVLEPWTLGHTQAKGRLFLYSKPPLICSQKEKGKEKSFPHNKVWKFKFFQVVMITEKLASLRTLSFQSRIA